jgi:addiction module RelB/DinJ family antitoxin
MKKKNMSSVINIRVDEATKNAAQKILEKKGFNLSSAIKLFLKNVAVDKSIVLNMRIENEGWDKKINSNKIKS